MDRTHRMRAKVVMMSAMRSGRVGLFLFSLVVLSGYVVAQDSGPPKGWKQVTACQFSFLVPENTQQFETHPIDSCLSAFEYEGLRISLDYGLYSAPLSEGWFKKPDSGLKNHTSQKLTINGRQAEVITYEDAISPQNIVNVTQVHIITFKSDASQTMISLLMSFRSKDESNADVIKQIYESLRFVGK